MASGEGIPGLADKLNHLFATAPGPGPGPGTTPTTPPPRRSRSTASPCPGCTCPTCAPTVATTRPPGCSPPWPSCSGCRISYFFDSTTEDTINANLDTLTALQNDQIKHLMQRAQGVSPRGLTHLQAILDQIRVLEGLDPDPDK